MTDIDAIIIGAGVIGLAIARELSMRGRSVIILESANEFGSATSSRNSEVIHAGLYYPPGSLKAKLCVEGKERLYDFCRTHGVAHRRCGKLIVATTDDETPLLTALREKGRANGCDDLRLIEATHARALEPALACVSALLSPSTGIIDSHGYMLRYSVRRKTMGRHLLSTRRSRERKRGAVIISFSWVAGSPRASPAGCSSIPPGLLRPWWQGR